MYLDLFRFLISLATGGSGYLIFTSQPDNLFTRVKKTRGCLAYGLPKCTCFLFTPQCGRKMKHKQKNGTYPGGAKMDHDMAIW
jgi:hypothetical protein